MKKMNLEQKIDKKMNFLKDLMNHLDDKRKHSKKKKSKHGKHK